MGLGGFDRFLDALTRRVDRLPPLPPPPGPDEGLVLTIRHAASGTAESVAEWQRQAAAGPLAWASDPQGLQVVIHFESWENPHIIAEDEDPTPASVAPDAPSPTEPPPLRLLVPWRCGACGTVRYATNAAADLGACEKCHGTWWTTRPKPSGGGAAVAW